MPAPATVTLEPTTDKPPRPRRWIPLSLRMFLALLLLLPVIGAAWIGIRAHARNAIAQKIEELGGWVVTREAAPGWLVRHSPSTARLFEETDGVYLIADKGYDDYYWHMNRFVYGHIVPESATFHATKISDADLAAICKLQGVSTLLLSGSDVTDAGVRRLRNLGGLEYLSLAGSQITDAALDALACLPDLAYLSLEDTRITDEGIRRLAKSPHLYWLLLDGSHVTDSGILHIADSAEIRYLSVRRTQVTDAGERQLTKTVIERRKGRLATFGTSNEPISDLFIVK